MSNIDRKIAGIPADIVNSLTEFMDQSASDESFRKNFQSDPKGVLSKSGYELPDGIDVEIVSDSEDTVHLIMPGRPK